MKKTVTVICIAVFLGIAAIVAIIVGARLTHGGGDTESEKSDYIVQNLDYVETTEKVNNPDQGFYRPIFVRLTESGATYNKNIINSGTQLYHLRTDISDFSTNGGGSDKPLSEQALNGFEELLKLLKERGKSAVVRFAYDRNYGGKKDAEPEFSVLLNHVSQLCAVLDKYRTTVTAVEAGLIGPWGEMHSSKIANAEHITPIISAYLENTHDLPILVRTPKMIYNYLGITINDIDGLKIKPDSPAYRLGLFNDGYLGSDSDLGTYSDRAREIEFLSTQTERLPYGGEVVIPNSPLHDIDKCLPEMFKINLSYLNIEWNNNVIDKWKNTEYDSGEYPAEKIYLGCTAFTYIENRLGYRPVLKNSEFFLDGKTLKINVEVENVGFGNMTKQKSVKLYFVKDGEIKQVENAGVFSFGKRSYSAKLQLESGEYGVYMCVYGEESEGKTNYEVRFANGGLWNENLKANKIGTLKV